MEPKGKRERELESCVDSIVDEMRAMYCADLTEERCVDSKMSDIKLRDELIGLMRETVRCKKISERIVAERGKDVAYHMRVRIDGNGIGYSISRDG